MANAELKSFIEDRLQSLDPSLDLSAGSPAQTQVVEPILTYLGTDPFETDIQKFISDRFAQEFPDIFASDPSAVYDTFVKPLILILEPFKRETQSIRRSQSLQDPSLLSDDDADALAANFFDDRDSGNRSVGVVRVFYQNPTNTEIDISHRFYTSNGLSYYPTNPMSMTAEQMIFNRSGVLFFIDVPVRAEAEGAEYNIDPETIIGVEGLFGAVKVTNLRRFRDGADKVDTETFVSEVRESLTERSLVNRRGATARILREEFQGAVRAVQVIGAKDEEMQRDLLVATSPGHAWLAGRANLFDKMAYVQIRTVDGEESDAPVPGDTFFIYLSKSAYPGVPQESRFVRFTVDRVILGPTPEAAPFQLSYVILFTGVPPTGITIPNGTVTEGGFIKKGTVQISSTPTGPVDVTVENGETHVYGHTDIYVRPVLQPVSKVVIDNLQDLAPVIERTTLVTNGAAGSAKNRVSDADALFDFSDAGVEPGDVLVIETGDDAGVFTVLSVTQSAPFFIYLDSNLSKSSTGLRYRVVKKNRIDPFDTRVLKFPFGSANANDASTTIGSKLIQLSTNDMLAYGVRAGDTIRLLSGTDIGDYEIQGFDSVLGGRGLLLDVEMKGSNSGLLYEVFTAQQSIEKPLVRIRDLLLLDSAKQSTGIVIPPAEPVAVIPTCTFTSAVVRGKSQRRSGFILPNIDTLGITGGSIASPVGGIYSNGFVDSAGVYRGTQFADGSFSELDFRDDAGGECSYFCMVEEFTDSSPAVLSTPPFRPSPGEALTIKSGPNQGSYLIEAVYDFKYHLYGGSEHLIYFVKVRGRFKYDILKSINDFLGAAQVAGASVTKLAQIAGSSPILFPDFFQDGYADIGTAIHTALIYYGAVSPGATAIQNAVDDLVFVDYEWGNPARGTLRTFFQAPTLFEQWTADAEVFTTYLYKTLDGDILKFRPDPTRYQKLQVIPARLDGDVEALEYPRDLDASVAGTATFTDPTRESPLVTGVRVGDVLAVNEEILLEGNPGYAQTAVKTTAGSNILVLPTNATSAQFTEAMVGDLLFIDEGDDAGAYRITSFISNKSVYIDKMLTLSTPNIVLEESSSGVADWGLDAGVGSKNVVRDMTATFTAAHLNKYMTLFGIDFNYQGSYKIKTIIDANTVELDRVGNFPAYPNSGGVNWVITDAPATAPAIARNGTELYGLRPIRIYKAKARELPILDISTELNDKNVTVDITLSDGYKQPYTIYRKNVRRITPTEMDAKKEGCLFYFDTDVLSLGPQETNNIVEGSYLVLEAGTYKPFGYRHVVNDFTKSYSMDESGFLDIPISVLPVGSADDGANFVTLVGTPIQAQYERADVVQELQEFLDSPQDRITSANMLARHFLPSYVSYDATYIGGSSASVVAKAIQAYVDGLTVEEPIDVSEIEKEITRRGGNPETPTRALVIIHDWDRRVWAEISENEVGGSETKVPYHGTPRVSFSIPGPDVSGQTEIPTGERINLTRL